MSKKKLSLYRLLFDSNSLSGSGSNKSHKSLFILLNDISNWLVSYLDPPAPCGGFPVCFSSHLL